MADPRRIIKAPKNVMVTLRKREERNRAMAAEKLERAKQAEVRKQLDNVNREINAILREKSTASQAEVDSLKLEIIRGIASDTKRKKRKSSKMAFSRKNP